MLKKSLLIFCVLSAAILIGCSATETHNTNSTTANSNSSSGSTTASTPATTTSTPATTTSTPATTTSTTSAGDKIGVPECDDFIAKYEACVSGKVPEIARARFQGGRAVERLGKNGRKPGLRKDRAAACKQARGQQEAALRHGCLVSPPPRANGKSFSQQECAGGSGHGCEVPALLLIHCGCSS